MYIEKLNLINYKNFNSLSISFTPRINCIVGSNGSGKTNILDAIFYLSMTRSAHNNLDNQNIKFENQFFNIKGTVQLDKSKHQLLVYYEIGKKKVFSINKNPYKKLSEHIGKFPAVMIAPDDTNLINDGSEVRRKFFDAIICQFDKHYLDYLVRYNHNLKQRNAVLKQFQITNTINDELISQYNDVLIELSQKIQAIRKFFLVNYSNILLEKYKFISGETENISIEYQSNYDKMTFSKKIKQEIQKDIALGRTSLGIHRDDYIFLIENKSVRHYASQGLKKTFCISLKLAQFIILNKELNTIPLLLLDDIFEKLDIDRIEKLLHLINNNLFGQIFITDAIKSRMEDFIKKYDLNASIFTVEKGVLVS